MGQEEWGHKQLFTDPLPPSSNRDKIHFSRGELVNTLWPLLILSGRDLGWIQFSFNIVFCKLPKVKDNASRNATNCVETETQKWTWDMGQKNLTPPPLRICPLFDELKKGIFLPPPPSCMDQGLLLSKFFFLKASLNGQRVSLKRCSNRIDLKGF